MIDARLVELKRRRLVLEDALMECGLNKQTLVEALRQHVFMLEGALLRGPIRERSHDITMTPGLARRARQRALDHLDVLVDGHRQMQIDKALVEAEEPRRLLARQRCALHGHKWAGVTVSLHGRQLNQDTKCDVCGLWARDAVEQELRMRDSAGLAR